MTRDPVIYRVPFACLLIAAGVLSWAARGTAQPLGPPEPTVGGWIGRPMYEDPEIEPVRTIVALDPRMRQRWLEALRADHADDRRQAAEAFRQAHAEGLDGLEPARPVLGRLVAADPDPRVRAAAANTLDALDDPAAAEALTAAITGRDPDLVLPADRALRRWGHAPAAEAWMTRVADGEQPLALRLSAAQGLGQLAHRPAIEPLSTLVQDNHLPVSLRLAAAEALGRIDREGLTTLAAPLAQSSRAEERLMAVRLLTYHPGWAELSWMTALAGDDDAAVSAAALQSINRSPELAATVRGMAERLTLDGRPNVRLQVAIARGRAAPDQAAGLLADMLDDPSVVVRSYARDRLIEIAGEPDGRTPVADAVQQTLAAPPGWRAAEQASLVAGRLDLDPAASSLVALLDHGRPEVRLAAADALRRLEVADVLPRVLDRAQKLTQRWSNPDDPDASFEASRSLDHELTQFFQFFGQMGYAEATPLLRRFVPKSSNFGVESRAAAIYALGKILEGDSDTDLAGTLRGRLADVAGMNPESEPVRYFSAITIGRFGAEKQLGSLRRFHEMEANTRVGAACRWAIGRITGQAPPPPEQKTVFSRGYFLEPTRERTR